MKTNQIVAAFAAAGLVLSAAAADSNDQLSGAVKALKEKSGYSWSSTSEIADAPFPAMTTKGKTEKDGFTLLTTDGQNGEVQAAKKGDKSVIKADDSWKTAEEFRQSDQGGPGPGRGFSGLLLNALAPAEDAEDLLKGIKDLKVDAEGVFTATLTDSAAKDLAGFFGRRGRKEQGSQGDFTPPEPKDAKGTVKFWVKDGVLTKVELKTTAKITFQDEDHDMNRTTTTEISDIGSTKVEVPEDAKKKLM